MSDWLDLQLSHHLAAVEAPDELWDRIQNGAAPRPASRSLARPRASVSFAVLTWPVAAILTLMVAAGTLWLVAKGEVRPLDLRQLAIEQLRDPGPVELQSSNPAEISAWMQQAGLEVPLGSNMAATVHLVGARVIEKRGTRIGEIRYRVGANTATLLVARAGSGPDSGHGQLAWRSRGQSFAIASYGTERPDAPCLLCHASL